MFPGLGFFFSLSVSGCGMTVNDPGLETLAVSFLAVLYRGTSDWNIKGPDLGSDSFTADPKVFWTVAQYAHLVILALLLC